MHSDLGGYNFKLGSVWGALVRAPIKFYFFSNLSLDLTPYFTYWRIGKSNFIPTSGDYGMLEPDSKTHEEGLLAGMSLYY